MPQISQEQYNTMRARGLDDNTISTLAKQRGYSLPSGKGFMQKAGDALDMIFGGKKVGEAIGTLAGFGITAGKEKLGLAPKGSTKAFDLSAPSPLQVAGDVAGAGLTVATLGGAGLTGGLGARVLKSGALGAGFGASEAVKEGGSVGDVSKSALTTGTVVGALPILGAGLRFGGRALTEYLPKSLMQSAIGQTKKELLANKDVSEFALKNMRFGTADTLIKKSQSSIDELSNKIATNLTTGTAPTTRILRNELISTVKNKINEGGGAITSKEVFNIVNKLAPQAKGLLQKQSLSLEEANKLRRLLDNTLGDRAFLTSQLPFNKGVLRSFADTSRNLVKDLAPEGTRSMFGDLSKEITMRNALMDKYAGKASNEVLNAFDVMIAGGGFLGGGAVGALGAVALKKTAQSAIGKTTTAVALSKLGALRPILQKLTTAERTLILKAIGQYNQPENPEQQ